MIQHLHIIHLQEAYTLESERNMVARHYEQTYDQVNHQIDSARQLVEIRKQSHDSPDRPYPRRPKNRVNINLCFNSYDFKLYLRLRLVYFM